MILDAIFRGDFAIDQFPYATDPAYKSHSKKISELTELINEKLGMDKSLLDDLLTEVYAAQYLETSACFRIGFAAGLELHKEVEIELEGLHFESSLK